MVDETSAVSAAGPALLAVGGLVRRAEVSPDGRALYQVGGRDADTFYRDRWSYDKVVRSTHGVNCTGSCSWKVYEPRGCPPGAAFSWYMYSPTWVRYPYARGVLVQMHRAAKAGP